MCDRPAKRFAGRAARRIDQNRSMPDSVLFRPHLPFPVLTL